MFAQVRLTRVFGIPIKIDMSWFIVFALIAWTLAFGYFPYKYPHLTAFQGWTMGITGALMLFVSVLIHELCHCYVARRNGIPIRGVTLFIFGGVSEMVEEPPSPGAEFLMAGAGPLGEHPAGHADGVRHAGAAGPGGRRPRVRRSELSRFHQLGACHLQSHPRVSARRRGLCAPSCGR